MKKNKNIVLIILYALLFIYVALRAFYLSFTFDEGLSFKIINGDQVFVRTANNHLLNTWLMQLCSFCFGNSEFSLRLPNVLSFALYIFFVHRMLALFRFPISVFIVIPFVLLNPFVLDFFSLARGYGLSMAFMMGALFYFFRFIDLKLNPTLNYFMFTMGFAALGLIANLSLINFYIAIFALCVLRYVFTKDRQTLKPLHFILACISATLPLCFGLNRLFFLKRGKELYFGTEVFGDTLKTLLERSIYFSSCQSWLINILIPSIMCFFVLALLFLLLRGNRSGPYVWIVSLLTLILLGLFIEHHLFDALYPVGRTGIYLVPLFALLFSMFVNNVISLIKGLAHKVSTAVLCLFIGGPLVFHFADKINLHYCYEWRHDANTKHVAELIHKKKFKTTARPSVAVTWIFEPAMNYYNISRNLNFNLLPWYNDEKNNAIYTIESNTPGDGWKEEEHFAETSSGLFYPVTDE